MTREPAGQHWREFEKGGKSGGCCRSRSPQSPAFSTGLNKGACVMPPKPKQFEKAAEPPKPIAAEILRDRRGAFLAGNQARLKHGVYAEYTVQPDEREIFLVFRTALADQFAEELGVDGILLDIVALEFVHHSRCMALGNYAAVQLIQPLIAPWLDRLKITRSAREHGNKRKQSGTLAFFQKVLDSKKAAAAAGQGDDEPVESERMRADPPVPPFAPPPANPDAPATDDRIAVIKEQVQRDASLKNAIKLSHNTGKPVKKTPKSQVLF